MSEPLMHDPSVVRPPLQERSRATLNRVLDATEHLLGERLLEEITLGDVLAHSGVSVGAFYARFRNKESLIPCLYDRYDRRLSIAAGRVLDRNRWAGRDLAARVGTLVRYVAMQYRRNQGLLRALALGARAHPDSVNSEQLAHRLHLYEATADFLLECQSEMTHPDPAQAVSLGLLMVGATLRDKILFDAAPHPRSVTASDRELARESSRALLSYLGARRSNP